jgi:hypothetical protein
MADTQTTEPVSVTAGDTVAWLQSLVDYPASGGWVLKYALRSRVGKIDLAAVASGDSHLISVTAATSATWPAGSYQYQKFVEKGSGDNTERVTLGLGSLNVAPSLAAMTVATDTRSWARRSLDSIEAVIEGRASRSDKSYVINTGNSQRSLESLTIKELLAARDDFAGRVWQEERPESLITPVRTVFVR